MQCCYPCSHEVRIIRPIHFIMLTNKKRLPFGSLVLYLVRREGFEPPTAGLEIRCSVQLSYRRVSINAWNYSRLSLYFNAFTFKRSNNWAGKRRNGVRNLPTNLHQEKPPSDRSKGGQGDMNKGLLVKDRRQNQDRRHCLPSERGLQSASPQSPRHRSACEVRVQGSRFRVSSEAFPRNQARPDRSCVRA